jgi:hypothetical protein
VRSSPRAHDHNQYGTTARLGPSGQRLQASAPFGYWKIITVIASLRHDQISAPWVIDGPSMADSTLGSHEAFP